MAPDERLAACGLTRNEIAARVADSRARQGLPPVVEDRAALARMAALVVRAHPSTPRP